MPPTPPPLRRKLAAILAADVVGYSKKMGVSEERTLQNLKLCRTITDASIATHHGRIFHTAGDSVIAEFASPVDALVAAVEFQRLLNDRNASCPVEDQLEFRVGLNLGDVIIEGDNLYGDGINIAARIEAIAISGGICVAHSVYSVVRRKVTGVAFTSRGIQTLKNIEDPVEVFDVNCGPMAPGKAAPSQERDKAASHFLKPVVSIEPIGTAGGDEGVTMLAAGLRDGIVSSLMKSSAVLVVKQQDSTAMGAHGQTTPQSQMRFNVSGSIQAAGTKYRIFINLENAVTGAQIWSKRFDKSSDDLFEIQDEVVQSINQDIRHKIKEANFERLETIADSKLALPDLLDKAAGYFVRDGRSALEKASHCLNLALALEPRHSMAMSMKAQCLDWQSDLSPYPVSARASLEHHDLLDQAIQLDTRNYFALALKADLQCHSGAYKECLRTAELALRVFPDFDQAKAIRALSNFHLSGDPQHLESVKRMRYFYLPSMALAWFSADLRDRALEDAELVFERMADFAYPALCAAVVISAYSADGATHPKVERFLNRHPDVNCDNCRRPSFGNPTATARFEAGLRRLFQSRM